MNKNGVGQCFNHVGSIFGPYTYKWNSVAFHWPRTFNMWIKTSKWWKRVRIPKTVDIGCFWKVWNVIRHWPKQSMVFGDTFFIFTVVTDYNAWFFVHAYWNVIGRSFQWMVQPCSSHWIICRCLTIHGRHGCHGRRVSLHYRVVHCFVQERCFQSMCHTTAHDGQDSACTTRPTPTTPTHT